jgi:hypothetical protein
MNIVLLLAMLSLLVAWSEYTWKAENGTLMHLHVKKEDCNVQTQSEIEGRKMLSCSPQHEITSQSRHVAILDAMRSRAAVFVRKDPAMDERNHGKLLQDSRQQ